MTDNSFSRTYDIQSLYSAYQSHNLHLSGLLPDNIFGQYEVNVTNTGSYISDVAVLGFLSSSISPSLISWLGGVTPPISQLVDFAHLHSISPGDSRLVVFTMNYRALCHYDMGGSAWLIPAHYSVTIGYGKHMAEFDQEITSPLTFEFELTGEPVLIQEHRSHTKATDKKQTIQKAED